MERKRCILIAAALLLSLTIMAQDNRAEIYSAYISNRMDEWKKVIDSMQETVQKDNAYILELINYQYGYVGYCLGFKKQKEAAKYLDLAEKNLTVLEKDGYKIPVCDAYRSAFYGFRISFNRFSAPVNGMKSLNHAKRSIENDMENYFGYIQYGNAYFYMPAAFGGSKKVALENYIKARQIMEKEPAETNKNWNYLSLLVTIGQCYTYLDQPDKAESVYEYILSVEPGFLYVRNELYPGLKKIKNEK
jgi:tetratricopeptide (TPR) repeat protein